MANYPLTWWTKCLLACLLPAVNVYSSSGQSLPGFTIRGHFTTSPPADTVYLYIGDKEFKAPVKGLTSFVISGEIPRTQLGYFSLRKGERGLLHFVDTGVSIISFAGQLYEAQRGKQSIPILEVVQYDQTVSHSFMEKIKIMTNEWSYPFRPAVFNQKVYVALDSLAHRYADNEAIPYLLCGYTGMLTTTQINKLRALLTVNARNGLYNKALEYELALSRQLELFKPVQAEKRQLKEIISLASAAPDSRKPGYIFIDFWATWCRPCLEELDIVKTEIPASSNVQVIAISFDEDSTRWKQTIVTRQIPGIQHLETKGFNSTLATSLALKYIPYNILIDPAGNVVATGIRGPILRNILKTIREE